MRHPRSHSQPRRASYVRACVARRRSPIRPPHATCRTPPQAPDHSRIGSTRRHGKARPTARTVDEMISCFTDVCTQRYTRGTSDATLSALVTARSTDACRLRGRGPALSTPLAQLRYLWGGEGMQGATPVLTREWSRHGSGESRSARREPASRWASELPLHTAGS